MNLKRLFRAVTKYSINTTRETVSAHERFERYASVLNAAMRSSRSHRGQLDNKYSNWSFFRSCKTWKNVKCIETFGVTAL